MQQHIQTVVTHSPEGHKNYCAAKQWSVLYEYTELCLWITYLFCLKVVRMMVCYSHVKLIKVAGYGHLPQGDLLIFFSS